MMKAVHTGAATIARTVITILGLLSLSSVGVFAQAGHAHVSTTSSKQPLTPAQTELLRIVRESTERFQNVSVAEGEGYGLLFGCVSGSDFGAMGLHFVKQAFLQTPPLTPSGEIDPTRPEIVLYEPVQGGGLRLIGADYLLFADAWDKLHPGNPPQLFGQLFHYFESPNRFGLPAFYTLHVWAWRENPDGAFVNWHPKVSCQLFSGQTP
jgi:hypothetical protein